MRDTYVCTKCGVEKPNSMFYRDRGWNHQPCKECCIARARAVEKNPEKRSATQARYRAKNKVKIAAHYQATKHLKNKAKVNEAAKRYREKAKAQGKVPWHRKNPESALAICRRRQAGLKTATVSWRNDFFIREAYDLARRRTKATGFAWHVDHIVPLKHQLVCGVHWEGNLQVIPGAENVRKSNASWPEMP